MSDPGIKLIRAKFRRHIEDYLRFVRNFGQIFTDKKAINKFRCENGQMKKQRGNRFAYEQINSGLEAYDYIFNSSEDNALLCFEPTCNFLGIDLHRLRRKLASLDEKNANQILFQFHKMYGH